MNSFIIKQLKNYAILLLFILSFQALSAQKTEVPFSTDSNYLTVWNGKKYIPIFIKGVNLGVAKPGSYPGELDVKPEQYRQWLPDSIVFAFTHFISLNFTTNCSITIPTIRSILYSFFKAYG